MHHLCPLNYRILRRVNKLQSALASPQHGENCVAQLAGVVTDIINMSLKQAVVPAGFKAATIILVPKKSTVLYLNE